jgi:hypothetical protein
MATMARKPRRSQIRREDAVVKVDAVVIDLARKVSALKEMTLAEYLSEVIRPIALNDLKVEAQRLTAS